VRVVAIVQARTGSTRLPRKVLMDLAGAPMLERVLARLGRCDRLDEVVVAITDLPGDDVLAELCQQRGWPCVRGSEQDVLDRYYRAATAHAAEAVVRITSDCPLIEPRVVDRVVDEFLKRQPEVSYASNVVPSRTYPRGLDTEVFTFAALERAWREDDRPAFREHVTPYINQNPELFAIHCVEHSQDLSHLRWTVDTPEDLELVRRIYETLGGDAFSWDEVRALLDQHPQWLQINRHVEQKKV